jgi:hypothetical protein
VDEIDINLIGDFIEVINSRILIEVVTADSFQSASLLQRMRRIRNYAGKRIRAGLLSVDRTLAPYSEVKQALRDGRLLYPDVDKVKQELRELMLDERRLKVDHPPKGSKDLSDCVAGVTYATVGRYANRDLRRSVRGLMSGMDAPEEPKRDKYKDIEPAHIEKPKAIERKRTRRRVFG